MAHRHRLYIRNLRWRTEAKGTVTEGRGFDELVRFLGSLLTKFYSYTALTMGGLRAGDGTGSISCFLREHGDTLKMDRVWP